ncbi:MAG: NAD(P)H-quinone oxidoreductase [Trueperaceae bacterium]|nr:NAD(P)H-quinone oxidoreductase [Trueperaceae bacterium]
MKAIIVRDDGSLAWQDAHTPRCGAEEVIIDVAAAGVNRADLAQRAGNYNPPPGASDILGLEVAGRVAEKGAQVEGYDVGDRVCALLTGGGYAEQVAVPYQLLLPMPDIWSFEQAAGVPEVFFTAFLNLFLEAGLQSGETALIHAGASGVGTAAIQLAKHAGCTVYITAGSDTKTEFCRTLGADLAINYNEQDFADVIANEGEGTVDVVLDVVGEPYFERNIALLKPGGRLVFIATLGGKKVTLDIRQIMAKRLMLKGSTLRARPLGEKIRIKEALIEQFWPALQHGDIRPILHKTFPIEDAEQAHAMMRDNQNIGKIILKVRD